MSDTATNRGGSDLEGIIADAILSTVEATGLGLVDVELIGGGGQSALSILVDRAGGGVTLDECAELSRDIAFLLETEGLEEKIPGKYRLEVGSPGIYRKLRRPRHYQDCVGKRARIKRRNAEDGKYTVIGMIEQADEQAVTVLAEEQDEPIRLEYRNIKQATLHPELDFHSKKEQEVEA